MKVSVPYVLVPSSKSIHRPLIRTKFIHKENGQPCKWEFLSVIDSGADFSLFPAELGKLAGYDIASGNETKLDGVFGTRKVNFQKVKMQILIESKTWDFEFNAAFISEKTGLENGLLGRNGFFDKFAAVVFKERQKFVELHWPE